MFRGPGAVAVTALHRCDPPFLCPFPMTNAVNRIPSNPSFARPSVLLHTLASCLLVSFAAYMRLAFLPYLHHCPAQSTSLNGVLWS